MARRGPAQKRKIEPDPVYGSLLVSQVTNKVLLDGKRKPPAPSSTELLRSSSVGLVKIPASFLSVRLTT